MRRFPGVSVEAQDALEAFAEYLETAGYVILDGEEAKRVRGPRYWRQNGLTIEEGDGASEECGVPLEWQKRPEGVLRNYLQYGDF